MKRQTNETNQDEMLNFFRREIETYLGGYTEEQRRAFFAKKSEYTAEEKKSYEKAGKGAKSPGEYSEALTKWEYKRALRLGMDSSISLDTYDNLKHALDKVREEAGCKASEVSSLASCYGLPKMQYVRHNDSLLESEREKFRKMDVARFAQSVRVKFLKMTMADRATFLTVLTSDDGNFAKLFDLQAAIQAEGLSDENLPPTRAHLRAIKNGKPPDEAQRIGWTVENRDNLRKQNEAAIGAALQKHPPAALPHTSARTLAVGAAEPKRLAEQNESA
jgi:hypothetical protein